MRAGALKHRLVVVRQTLGEPDALNEQALTWVDQPSVACSRHDVSDAERDRAAGQGDTLTTRFVVRNTSETRAITRRDRLRCEGQLYDIGGIKRVDDDRGLEISASAAADAFLA